MFTFVAIEKTGEVVMRNSLLHRWLNELVSSDICYGHKIRLDFAFLTRKIRIPGSRVIGVVHRPAVTVCPWAEQCGHGGRGQGDGCGGGR